LCDPKASQDQGYDKRTGPATAAERSKFRSLSWASLSKHVLARASWHRTSAASFGADSAGMGRSGNLKQGPDMTGSIR